MNPLLLLQLAQMAKAAFEAYPAIKAEFEAVKLAATASPSELAEINAQIEAMDAARLKSWADADAALLAASRT